ncbi:MAG: homoserine dehydrogenase, partial [Burkholderiales bacterium]
MDGALRIGIAGLGTVGAGTVRLLQEHGNMLAQRCSRPIVVSKVCARDRRRDRGVDVSRLRWVDDALALARDPEVDVVVELIGGADGIAKQVVETAIASGKHAVTANKALLAHHGAALARAAEAAGVTLAYEAAVAGGIPIIKALREGLAGNRVERIYGILNGTCNYILTTMRKTGREFADVLAEAQALGYAEPDPTADVEGFDAAYKLAILASLMLGRWVSPDEIERTGISGVTAEEIADAKARGGTIRLIASAERDGDSARLRVAPTFIPGDDLFSRVVRNYNAIEITGDRVGPVLLHGQGAGPAPTSSAILSDIVEVARIGS